jgi:anti-sigma-K factor RskA
MAMSSAAHDELRDQAAAYVLGALTTEERRAFEAHLHTCSECEGEVRALTTVAGALSQTVPQLEPPAALRDRVVPGISGRQRQSRAADRAARIVEARPARSAAWLGGLAAAASLAAVALGGYALQLQGRLDTLEVRLQDALARAEASANQIAEARRVSNSAQSQLAILMAPDVMRVDLAGLKPAPSASARAFWSRSRGLVFAASSLPALPAGRTYQLWFVAGKDPISAGIFEPDASGAVNILLTVDPNVARPDVLAVTVEAAGGVTSPTLDTMILAGKVQTI